MRPSSASITEPPYALQRRSFWLWAIGAAIALTLAFPSPGIAPLAWCSLAPFFTACILTTRTRRAFALGYLFGLVHFGWLVLWVGKTVVGWSGSSLGWIAWIGLTGILSLWFGLAGVGIRFVARRSSGFAQAAGMAAVWTLVEWMRSQGALAMPWCLLGYSQYRFLPVIQAADLGGVYLVGFVVALANAGLAQWHVAALSPISANPARKDGPFRHYLLRPLLAVLLCVCYGLAQLQASVPGSHVRVCAVQTGLRTTRTGSAPVSEELAILAERNKTARQSNPALVVWPEGGAPGAGIGDPLVLAALSEMTLASGAYHLIGTAHEEDGSAHNSAALFGPDGALLARYDKQWLVPYGEWVPGRSWLPLLGALHAPGRDLASGRDPRPVTKGPFSLGVMICFESVFPPVSRLQTRNGANLLALITNDSWSGTHDVLWQHAAMTVFRAVENRRFVVLSATTGITGIAGSDGTLRTLPPATGDVLSGEVQLRGGLTPYTRFGDWFVLVCAGGVVAFPWRRKRS